MIEAESIGTAKEDPFFVQFVFHHAPGARTLRFVRKMPLLKGLSDNALLDVAARMTEEQFEVSFIASPFTTHSD